MKSKLFGHQTQCDICTVTADLSFPLLKFKKHRYTINVTSFLCDTVKPSQNLILTMLKEYQYVM